jgi:hypothetical protein
MSPRRSALNAFIVATPEAALEAAGKATDAKRAAGSRWARWAACRSA